MQNSLISFNALLQESYSGNIEGVMDVLPSFIQELELSGQFLTAIQIILKLSTVFLEIDEKKSAAILALFGLKFSIKHQKEKILPLMVQFAVLYPIEHQPVSMIGFYTSLLSIIGDKDQVVRKKLILFAISNYNNPVFIQKMYLQLYKSCFHSRLDEFLIENPSKLDNIETSTSPPENHGVQIGLKALQTSKFLIDNIPLHFARYLWSISKSEYTEDFDTPFDQYSYQYTKNAIFLRAVLAVALLTRNLEKASRASRTLFESILPAKPPEVDISFLNHPFYRCANFITKILLNYKKLTSETFKKAVCSYETILFQDSELTILIRAINKKYFKC